MAVPNEEIANTGSMKSEQLKRESGSHQKAAGMAWGGNSPSLRKHRSHDNNDFGDFGKYMAEKKRKLSLQFQSEASSKNISYLAPTDVNSSSFKTELPSGATIISEAAQCRDLAKLFEGISIFVDGFTIPSHQELRTLMLKHGGTFENYFCRDLVTHIICSTLPDSKIRDHRSFSRGLPIVKPSWVVDSISSGKVLPLSSYYHERIARNHPNQCTLSTFLDCKKGDLRKHSDHAEVLPPPESIKSLQPEVQYEKQGSSSDTDSVLNKCHLNQPRISSSKRDMKTDSYTAEGLEPGPNLPHGSSSLDIIEDTKPGSSSENVRSHCTLGDANFVQNYFKNSRLHFIGTWRTRYQSRFNGSKVDKDQEHEQPNSISFSSDSADRTIMHVDMDCFFVSVVVRNRPLLAGKPVAVCHSEKTHGTAEISSSNYAARAFGIRSGMFIRDAKALCPALEVVPYDFEGYQQVADQFYDVLHRYCNKVQAISCDEAYLDVTGVGDPEALASNIRKEIVDLTRCTASVGIAENLLLARMATRKAKPDGLYKIDSEQVERFLADLSVEDLPGVGWSLQEKLHNRAIYNCSQLCAVSKETLQRDFGSKTGDMLWCYARGIDHRQVQNYQERKSIGAEVNWGVRFDSANDAQHFLTNLCGEVSTRLQNAVVCGRTFTLKIKKRKGGAGEPQKFMGCGSCDNLSKSVTLACATSSVDVLLRVSRQIFASFHLDVREIRGMGLQVTKLESSPPVSSDRGQQQQKALESCLQFSSKETPVKDLSNVDHFSHESKEKGVSEADKLLIPSKEDECVAKPWGLDKSQVKERKGMQSLGKILKGPFSRCKQEISGKDKEKQKASAVQSLPHVSELDYSVLASLPPEVLAELDDAYNGAVAQRLSVSESPQASRASAQVHEPSANGSNVINAEKETEKCIAATAGQLSTQISADGQYGSLKQGALEDAPSSSKVESRSRKRSSQKAPAGGIKAVSEQSMVLSLSQVDMTTLEELPTQVREDILKALPVHRPIDFKLKHDSGILTTCGRSQSLPLEEAQEPCGISICKESCSEGSHQLDDLWCGSPPRWVFLFKGWHGAGAEILHLLAKGYLDCGYPENFSSILLHVMGCYKLCMHEDLCHNLMDSVAFQCCLELLKQYLKLKVSCNLEEVFTVIQVLKRLAGEGQFWEKICEFTVPFVQAATGECYGGTLYNGP